MERLPSPEERQWLVHALRRVIARRGAQLLDGAPLVEPTNEWFPEKWSTTAAHGHRLAQRLLFYAGLSSLQPTLSAYQPQTNEDGSEPWDAGTAGWFAGIDKGRAHFGLHVAQFGDPEAAAGVLAHEVAHAWRAHHRLVVEERQKEELFTDVTTIALGFGILSTNNTDRYRSSGDWSRTSWSFSSAGYLPPQAMAYLLAVWCTARGKRGEAKVIEKHLEPNQRASFRAALEEIERSGTSIREHLTRTTATAVPESVRPESFTPYDPAQDEITEPQHVTAAVHREEIVHPTPKGSTLIHLYIGTAVGALAGFLIGVTAFGDDPIAPALYSAAAGAIAFGAFLFRRSRRDVCSACGASIVKTATVCSGCNGTIGARMSARELAQLRLDKLEERAARDVDYDECEDCEPERPCPVHAATERIGPPELLPEPEEIDAEPRTSSAGTSSGRGRKILIAVAACIVIATLALAWWRQNHVRVYFDNAIGRPLLIAIDGTNHPLPGRLSFSSTLAPGPHRFVVHDGGHEIESFDAVIRKRSLADALLSPRFYIYNAGAAGIYQRARYVYSTIPAERVSDEHLIGLERWIEESEPDYLFREAPSSMHSSRATLTTFEIAHQVDFVLLANAWYGEGRTEDALRALRRAIEIDPCHAIARNAIVGILQTSREHPRAIAEGRDWIEHCDDSVVAHRTYQDLIENDAQKTALTASYRERVQRNPTAMNHYLYGRLLHGEAAMSEFRESMRLDPKENWARTALGYELLLAERDQEAFDVLAESLRAEFIPPNAPAIFAMTAAAANRLDEVQTELDALDPATAWDALWIVAHAKADWPQASRLLALREGSGAATEETTFLRARMSWNAGDVRESLLADLRNRPHTETLARELTLEDAFENGRFGEAAAITDVSDLHRAYAAEAALLANAPVEGKLDDPFANALVDAAYGRIDALTLLTRTADLGPSMRTHVYFALAVRASSQGHHDEAAQLYRRSAARAFTREFPYRAALRLAAAQ